MAKTTQEERDRNENHNIQVVNDFKDYWDNRGNNLRQQNIGLKFRAQVNYTSSKANAVVQTEVWIPLSGYGDDGKIEITASGALTTAKFHLGVAPAFGTYALDEETGELSYSNSSAKMGGNYMIRITPLV